MCIMYDTTWIIYLECGKPSQNFRFLISIHKYFSDNKMWITIILNTLQNLVHSFLDLLSKSMVVWMLLQGWESLVWMMEDVASYRATVGKWERGKSERKTNRKRGRERGMKMSIQYFNWGSCSVKWWYT